MYTYDEKPIQRVKTYIVHDFVKTADGKTGEEYTESATKEDKFLWKSARDIQKHKIKKGLEKGKTEANREIGNIPGRSDNGWRDIYKKAEDLGINESLILISHGAVAEDGVFRFGGDKDGNGGYSASELAEYINANSLLPDGYSGMIYLDGCQTGEKLFENKTKSFVDYFAMELGKNRRLGNFGVKGNIGEARTIGEGDVVGDHLANDSETGEYVELTYENLQQFLDNLDRYLKKIPVGQENEKQKKYREFYEQYKSAYKQFLGAQPRLEESFLRKLGGKHFADFSGLYVRGKFMKHFVTRDEAAPEVSEGEESQAMSMQPTSEAKSIISIIKDRNKKKIFQPQPPFYPFGNSKRPPGQPFYGFGGY